MTNETKKHFDRVLDCYGGLDGGVAFTRLKALIEALDKKAENGDAVAQESLEATLYRFSRLIEIAQRL